MIREPYEGMGQAVARRTVFRPGETWKEVAKRVSDGNCSLHVTGKKDRDFLEKYISEAAILMSGRHLQHGDKEQKYRAADIYINCATSATSFMLFNLLLGGSGVGRSYDDDLMLVDWDHMPKIRAVLSFAHPDYNDRYDSAEVVIAGTKESQRPGSYKIIEVEDSREGWAKAFEVLEVATWLRTEKNKTYIFDFSKVRPNGSPIKGMQDRLSPGPVPYMKALYDILRLVRGKGMSPWKQNIFVDHFIAKSVVAGGNRRSARMATKYWKDEGAFEFCTLKRDNPETLWSANYSLMVDKEFWDGVRNKDGLAWKLFLHATKTAYGDKTGEPGLINYDKLNINLEDIDIYEDGDWISEKRYKLNDETKQYHRKIYQAFEKTKVKYITNPCQPGFATVATPNGIRQFNDINIGDIIWSGKRWTKIINKVFTGVKDIYEYRTNAGSFIGTDNHRIISSGEKIEVANADSIDINQCGTFKEIAAYKYPQDIMDGLVLGDGGIHKASNNLIILYIGKDDQDYFTSEIADLIGDKREGINLHAYEINTYIEHYELPHTFSRSIPDRYRFAEPSRVAAFLRGIYSANGSVIDNRVTLKSSSFTIIKQVQEMLSFLGIKSYYTTNKSHDVEFENGVYECKESYDLNVSTDRDKFALLIGFIQKYKNDKLHKTLSNFNRKRSKNTYDIVSIIHLGQVDVFDITVDDPDHNYWTGGLLVSNCSEIPLFIGAGNCTIADIVPYHLSSLEEFEIIARLTTRALIRVNLMNTVYRKEIDRTNRIGVGLTGIHEFAWHFFGLCFKDLLDESKSQVFWDCLKRIALYVDDEAEKYAKELGVRIPHTTRTIKPAGTTSKLFHLTEGIHLPPMKEYIRWVQFKNGDPLIEKYRQLGYPTKELKNYNDMTIVGFPHRPEICNLEMNNKLVLASDATLEEQYQWLILIEKYWLFGDKGNQASYTNKYNPDNISIEQFRKVIAKYQPLVKCCSVMPQVDSTVYEYQPEQPISTEEFILLKQNIKKENQEIRTDEIKCDAGACPI